MSKLKPGSKVRIVRDEDEPDNVGKVATLIEDSGYNDEYRYEVRGFEGMPSLYGQDGWHVAEVELVEEETKFSFLDSALANSAAGNVKDLGDFTQYAKPGWVVSSTPVPTVNYYSLSEALSGVNVSVLAAVLQTLKNEGVKVNLDF